MKSLFFIIRLIIQYVEGRGPQDEWRGYVLALGLFLVATLQSMFLQQYFDKAVITGLRVRSAFLGIVYRKVMPLFLFDSKGSKSFLTGKGRQLLNFVQKQILYLSKYNISGTCLPTILQGR